MDSQLDLSKVRHDLRTPINHILGYCEMLLEEADLPERLEADLRKIHGGGKHLLDLIGRYFTETTFGDERNLQQLQHELRTPVNHIIGYSELLQEVAAECGAGRLIPDLQHIHEGAIQWLALMEEHLIPAAAMFDPEMDLAHSGQPALAFVTPGISFHTLRPKSAEASPHWNAGVLVVDDDQANRELLARRIQRYGARTTLARNGLEALQLLRKGSFDLVLLDLLMPGLDGYQVLVKLKADPKLRHIPVIMISGLDQENGIIRCLEMGAEDYLTKPFNPLFLRARIGACLEKKHWRDKEQATFEALRKTQRHLAAELAEAGAYVRSLLPPPISGPISASWSFQPSAQLGGDAFGYHWLDPECFAMYLLDVCGHGIGAALLSMSALNVLRSRALPTADFRNPANVLSELNRVFQMERQNQMYFTIWYGVFNTRSRELAYASGGHPPALLFEKTGGSAQLLRTRNPPIGGLPDAVFTGAFVPISESARLLLFSDGVYEIKGPDGTTQTFDEFVRTAEAEVRKGLFTPEALLEQVQQRQGNAALEDDFSLVELHFERTR